MNNKTTLRLFNAIYVKDTTLTSETFPSFIENTIEKGYIIDPLIYPNAAKKSMTTLFHDIQEHVLTFTQWNNSSNKFFFFCFSNLL